MAKDLAWTATAEAQAPEERRWWLVCKALESVPLSEALDLATAAYSFLGGSLIEGGPKDIPARDGKTKFGVIEYVKEEKSPLLAASASSRSAPVKRSALSLSPERRTVLLRRLANGANNAELAQEFGLSRQQVQGVRM